MTPIFGRSRSRRPEKVGLALGSGSARGWAHIGVLRALSEAGVHVDCVAGTSIGSLVGAVFASGKLASLETVVRELDWKRALALFDIGLPRSGLLDGRNVTSAIRDHVGSGTIQDLTMPFEAVSTNLLDGSEVHIGDGDIIEAVRASISIPGVFTPVRRDEMLLVDGGLVNPVPTSVARAMGAAYVIAVDLNHGAAGLGANGPWGREHPEVPVEPDHRGTSAADRLRAQLATIRDRLAAHAPPGLPGVKHRPGGGSTPNILEVMISSLTIMEMQITEMRLAKDPPDLLVRPALGHINPMDFHRGAESIEEGYRATRGALEGADARIFAPREPTTRK